MTHAAPSSPGRRRPPAATRAPGARERVCERLVGAPPGMGHSGGRGLAHAGLGTTLALVGVGLVAAALVGRARRPALAADAHTRRAVRRTRDGAAILGTSVLADSAMEHFRGGYHNHAMYVAPATAVLSIAASLAEPRPGSSLTPARIVNTLALAVGAAGMGFHLYNVTKRPGGISWNNLFYAAPIGAPGALTVAGLLGLATEFVASRPAERVRNARLLTALAGAALTGESAEVWLLHFRGAFHNPAMYLPVTIPPAAALLLLGEAARPSGQRHELRPEQWRGRRQGHRPSSRRVLLRWLLRTVNALGLVGTLFHVYGVSRQMGGWANWRQAALAGPPVPAPVSFTGLGLAGLAALGLLEHEEDER